MKISELNQLDRAQAAEGFFRCCGCRAWADRMADGRPYADGAQVHAAADAAALAMTDADWLEAFTAHPRIGDVESLRKKFADTKAWASSEQSGVQQAAEDVIRGLADGNAEYERRFGHIFIVCATGKSAAEMLDLLRRRLPNNPGTERRIAAAEQMKITHIRIDKWLED